MIEGMRNPQERSTTERAEDIEITIPLNIYEKLCKRFLESIPNERLNDYVKLGFQLELAHWYYLDNYLPNYPTLRRPKFIPFVVEFLARAPQPFSMYDPRQVLDEFNRHKSQMAISGAIVVSKDLKSVLLVQNLFTLTWGFPKGKVEENESLHDCAIREVREEAGLDISGHVNTGTFLEVLNGQNKKITLFLICGVESNRKLKPQTKGEIKSVKWFYIDYLITMSKINGVYIASNNQKILSYVILALIKSYDVINSMGDTGKSNDLTKISSSILEESTHEVTQTDLKDHPVKLSDWNFLAPIFSDFKFSNFNFVL